ncbi:MAG: hypothetical protein LBF41_02680 [Deltaproteobacteria bacterium]|jgi:hypothetical protein|nr:hypothetical protein [Deltaproteobacteria bacterium]
MSPKTPERSVKKPSLQKLLRRIIWSFGLAILGSWGMVLPRLGIIRLEDFGKSDDFWFYCDLASMSVAIFGLLMVCYHNSKMKPRLKRLEEMGESRWGLF